MEAWTIGMSLSMKTVMSLLAAALLVAVTGCEFEEPVQRGVWHAKYSWKPERYFRKHPQVVELCYAIEAKDLAEVERLVATGADVNTQGVANMTPLLWAYPNDNLEVFVRLLELGADPNVLFESDLNTRGALEAGNSVTHLATNNPDHDYFDAVFRHGGDPNLTTQLATGLNNNPIFLSIKWGGADKRDRLQALITYGANLNGYSRGVTPAMAAVSWMGQYDIALFFLESGADMSVRKEHGVMQLVHFVERDRKRPKTPEQNADYQALVTWMKNHGASFAQARKDIDRWTSTPNFDVRKERARVLAEESRAKRKAAQSAR